jgi:hypothetical protein
MQEEETGAVQIGGDGHFKSPTLDHRLNYDPGRPTIPAGPRIAACRVSTTAACNGFHAIA